MNRKFVELTFCVLTLCASTSCASIFCGSKANVTFDSNIKENVTLTIDGIKHNNVTFPYTTKVARGFNDTIVKAEAKEHKTETIMNSRRKANIIFKIPLLIW